jgi:hypothetical protein
VRAAVVAPEPELRRWFSWQWYWTDALVDDLVGEGRLRRAGGHVIAVGQSRPDAGPDHPAIPGTSGQLPADPGGQVVWMISNEHSAWCVTKFGTPPSTRHLLNRAPGRPARSLTAGSVIAAA